MTIAIAEHRMFQIAEDVAIVHHSVNGFATTHGIHHILNKGLFAAYQVNIGRFERLTQSLCLRLCDGFFDLDGSQSEVTLPTNSISKPFSNFDAKKVAKYDQKKIESLLQDDSIIRNRLKVTSAVNNAKQFLKVQKEFDSFDKYIWGFVNHKPLKNKFKKLSEIPASTTISEKMSKDLRKRGFNFVGPTICYALMQAIGMVNDHTTRCFLYQK